MYRFSFPGKAFNPTAMGKRSICEEVCKDRVGIKANDTVPRVVIVPWIVTYFLSIPKGVISRVKPMETPIRGLVPSKAESEVVESINSAITP